MSVLVQVCIMIVCLFVCWFVSSGTGFAVQDLLGLKDIWDTVLGLPRLQFQYSFQSLRTIASPSEIGFGNSTFEFECLHPPVNPLAKRSPWSQFVCVNWGCKFGSCSLFDARVTCRLAFAVPLWTRRCEGYHLCMRIHEVFFLWNVF